MTYTVYHGDCLDLYVLENIQPGTITCYYHL